MSNNTTQLGGTASSVTVGKIGVSMALILSLPITDPRSISILAWVNDDDVRTSPRRILSWHRYVFPSWRDPAVSDEEAFASLKAGMDSLPPGAKMFLNSGAYTNGSIQIHLALSMPPFMTHRRVLWAQSPKCQPRASRALLRAVPCLHGQGVPLCEGEQFRF